MDRAAYNRNYWSKNKKELLAKRRTVKYKKQSSEYSRNRRLLNKVRALAQLNCVCSKCGFDEPGALHFHHLNPEDKKFEIMKLLSSNRKIDWVEVDKEIAKCILLCANCHLLHHCDWITKDVYRETLRSTTTWS